MEDTRLLPCTFAGRESLFPLFPLVSLTPINEDKLCNNLSVLVHLLQHNQIDAELIPQRVIAQAYDWYKLSHEQLEEACFNYGGFCGKLSLKDPSQRAKILGTYASVQDMPADLPQLSKSSLPQVVLSKSNIALVEKYYNALARHYSIYEMPLMPFTRWHEGGLEGAWTEYKDVKAELSISQRKGFTSFGQLIERGFARLTFTDTLLAAIPEQRGPGRPRIAREDNPELQVALDNVNRLRRELSDVNEKRKLLAEQYNEAMALYRLLK